jgi:hypothetical protein
LRAIGVGAPVNCCDVYGFDDELLAFLPRPVYAILFVFPDYRKFDQLYRHVYEDMVKQGATVSHTHWGVSTLCAGATGHVLHETTH